MKKSEKYLLRFLSALILLGTIVFGGILAQNRYAEYLENRGHPVSREDIESRTAVKTPPVLTVEGTVDGHNFELVMRGFTNYFMKETWGAERGQHFFLGGQKPGGYEVVIRTAKFNGEWSYGWHGTGGGGGGGGVDEYQDDFLPGRWLWNKNGFVGAQTNYECHTATKNFPPIDGVIFDSSRFEEEYENCEAIAGILMPKKIVWTVVAKHYGYEPTQKQRTFKVKSYKFENEPSEDWFAAQVKNYFPDSAHFKITNSTPSAVSTNQQKNETRTGGAN